MESWVLILIVVLVGAVVFLATRPRHSGVSWHNPLPVFYDHLPVFITRGGGWGGRGGGYGGGHGGGHHGRHH